MSVKKKKKDEKKLIISIPLTEHKGKIRVKRRQSMFEYGIPVSTRNRDFRFSQQDYIEWQISYDLEDNPENSSKSSIPYIKFEDSKGRRKIPNELTEYFYHFLSWGVIKKDEVEQILDFMDTLKEENLIENYSKIKRTHPVETKINNIDFYASTVEYPHLIHRFGQYEIITEIVVREQQFAVGIQPMLFFCFPVTELKDEEGQHLLGRSAKANEKGYFEFNVENSFIILEMIKIFGMLSKRHNYDIKESLKQILNVLNN